MTLKATYDSKSEIPEGLSEHYTEKDDKFVLQVDGMKSQGDFDGVKKALTKERDKNEELTRKLSKYPDDFDPEKWDELKHIDPESIGGDESVIKQRDSLKETNANLKERISELEGNLKEAKNFNKKKEEEVAIKDALMAAGVTDDVYLKSALNWVKENERINTVENGQGYKTTMGDLDKTPEEYAQDFVETDVGKRFAMAPENRGGGSRNNGTPQTFDNNPFDLENPSRSGQQKVMNQDRKKAKQMAKAAGWPDDKIQRVFG